MMAGIGLDSVMTGIGAGLSRSLSLAGAHKKHRLSSKQEADEMNIFGSDIVSREYLLERFKDVKHDSNIVKLEVEDMLIATTHHSFLPVFKALVVSDKRAWKYAKFVDSIDSDDFPWWESMKNVIMREYETGEEESKYAAILSFEASINVTQGTSNAALSRLLQKILTDQDVQSVSFGGALYGHCQESAPKEVPSLFDANNKLEVQLVINVCCGWACPNSDTCAWRGLVDACVGALQKKQEAKPAIKVKDPVHSSDEHSVRSTRSGRSFRSTRSARSGSGSRSPIPMRSIHLHQGNQSSSPGLRRCLTSSQRHHQLRPLPHRSKSFQLKRPSTDSFDGAVPTRSGNRSLPPRANSAGSRTSPARNASFKIRRPATRRSEHKSDSKETIMEIVKDLQIDNALLHASWDDIRGPSPKSLSTRQLLVRSNSFHFGEASTVDDDDENNRSIMDIVEDLKETDIASSSSVSLSSRKDRSRSVDLSEPASASSSLSRPRLERKSSSKRSNLRRAKSVNMNSKGNVHLPDYDWAGGDQGKKKAFISKAA